MNCAIFVICILLLSLTFVIIIIIIIVIISERDCDVWRSDGLVFVSVRYAENVLNNNQEAVVDYTIALL